MNDETIYQEYCFNRMMHLNTPATITEKGGYRIVDGKVLTDSQFNKKYPLKIRARLRSLQNIDNTKKWML